MAISETVKGLFSSTKQKVMVIIGIITAVVVVAGLIVVIVILASRGKMLTFHPEIKVVDIENKDNSVSQKALDGAIEAGKSIYNRISNKG